MTVKLIGLYAWGDLIHLAIWWKSMKEMILLRPSTCNVQPLFLHFEWMWECWIFEHIQFWPSFKKSFLFFFSFKRYCLQAQSDHCGDIELPCFTHIMFWIVRANCYISYLIVIIVNINQMEITCSMKAYYYSRALPLLI